VRALRRGDGAALNRAMGEADETRRGGRILPWILGLTVPLYLLDQLTKFWVIRRFSEPEPGFNFSGEPPIVVIDGFLNWVRVHNQGVAFGMGNGTEWAPLVFPLISLLAFVLIGIGLRTDFFYGRVGRAAVALLLAGIVGNLTDRLVQGHLLARMEGASWWERFKAGYVVDFIDVTIPLIDYRWPSFNVADSCICIAAVLILVSGWKAEREGGGTSKGESRA